MIRRVFVWIIWGLVFVTALPFLGALSLAFKFDDEVDDLLRDVCPPTPDQDHGDDWL